jgi:SNF2 family DNA or RNA helicase
MTGTPFGRDPQDLWSQFYLVDGGEALGETLGLFRAGFFKTKKGFWADEYVFDKHKEKLLHRAMAHSSVRFPANEADLPRVVPIVKQVILPDEANSYYRKAVEAVINASKNRNLREMQSYFLRMRQISSGFVGFIDDETGDRAQYEFKENPKLDMLMSILTTIPEESKAIIFHDFHCSGAKICAALKEYEIPHLYLYGMTKDPQTIRKEFEHGKHIRVLVLSNAAGWAGINLQIARYGIYYESPVPVIMRKQTSARFIRQYSPHEHVFLYDLVVKGTADEKILHFHKEGGDLFRAIVDGKAATIFG